MNDNNSKSLEFHQVHDTPITVRTDAPCERKCVIIQLAYETGFHPTKLHTLLCRILRKRQIDSSWSKYPNIDREVRSFVDDSKWYRVYDVLEIITNVMRKAPYSDEYENFETEMNGFIENDNTPEEISV